MPAGSKPIYRLAAAVNMSERNVNSGEDIGIALKNSPAPKEQHSLNRAAISIAPASTASLWKRQASTSLTIIDAYFCV